MGNANQMTTGSCSGSKAQSCGGGKGKVAQGATRPLTKAEADAKLRQYDLDAIAMYAKHNRKPRRTHFPLSDYGLRISAITIIGSLVAIAAIATLQDEVTNSPIEAIAMKPAVNKTVNK